MSQPPLVVVLGGTGRIGQQVVRNLLAMNGRVRVHCVVRSKERLTKAIDEETSLPPSTLTVTECPTCILDVTAETWREILNQEQQVSVVCCLGRDLSPLSIWGPPYRLISTVIQRIVMSSTPSTRIVLLANDGVVGSGGDGGGGGADQKQQVTTTSWSDRTALGLIRTFIPPLADLEAAASYLSSLPQNHHHWVVVRPADAECDEQDGEDESIYVLSSSASISPFSPTAVATRSQVAHSLTRLAVDDTFFQKHRNTMPVLRSKNKKNRSVGKEETKDETIVDDSISRIDDDAAIKWGGNCIPTGDIESS